MNISREEAAAALDSVESADRRMDTLRIYRGAAPFLQLWGAVWFIANVASDLWPSQGSRQWLLATLTGLGVSVGIGYRQATRRVRLGLHSPAESRRIGRSFALLGITILAFFVSMSFVLGDLDARQTNAFICLFWAITYMAAGSWIGMRLFLTGAIAVVGIVAGYLYVHQHFELWMAFFGGGSLLLAGLWLRRP
jgi:hypothetical protein